MVMRIVSGVVLSLGPLGNAAMYPLQAQVLPHEVITEALRHVVTRDTALRVLVATDGFPDSRVANQAASGLGLRAGSRSDLVRCDDNRRTCEIPDGDRVIALHGLDVSLDLVRLRLLISTEAVLPDGTARAFPQLREITLSRANGRWSVTNDRVLVQG